MTMNSPLRAVEGYGERPLLLDVFSGSGGAARGYYDAGFRVIGVDLAPEPLRHYPFPWLCADALETLARLTAGERLEFSDGHSYGLEGIAAIHASPPCQRYTLMNQRWPGGQERHPDLVPRSRDALIATGVGYIIENVIGAPMRDYITLCGRSFGLGTHRHRKFESTFGLLSTPLWCKGWRDHAGVYGSHPDGGRIWTRKDGHAPLLRVGSLEEASERMGIDWMEWSELKEAIPPAYTEFIGQQLLRHLEAQP